MNEEKTEIKKSLKRKAKIRNEFLEEEIERNREQANCLTKSNYGEIYEIIELNGNNQEGEYVLREREIFFKETLRTLNKLSFHPAKQQEV